MSSPVSESLSVDLQRYLQEARDAVLHGLDGLSEYDARRTMTPTGTNILGLVKHLIGIETGYLGECLGRPSPIRLPWNEDGSVWEGADMWAREDEDRDYLVGLYRQSWSYADAAIAELPLNTPAEVSWWSEDRRATTFGHLLVRVVAETAQHAGHVDIVRELIDGTTGSDTAGTAEAAWHVHRTRLQAAADAFR